MNLPLRPWLPGSWTQPPAHTESRGPWRYTAADEREGKGKERYLVQRLKRNSFNPPAFLQYGELCSIFSPLTLGNLIFHNILIMNCASLWESEMRENELEKRLWLFIFTFLTLRGNSLNEGIFD